jgi:hypothetical protein
MRRLEGRREVWSSAFSFLGAGGGTEIEVEERAATQRLPHREIKK